MNTKYDSWSKKTDEQLAEILKAGDEEEQTLAGQFLRTRYQSQLFSYFYNKLPYEWLEHPTQEMWAAIYATVKDKGIEKGLSNLLWTIAKRTRAQAVRKLTSERNVETNISEIEKLNARQRELISRSVEEDFLEQENRQIALHLPFTTYKLSDCERVVWTLRQILGYSPSVVARLMGKDRGTIDTTLYNARKKWETYKKDSDFHLTSQELDRISQRAKLQKSSLVLDRFACPMTPQLTPDELQRLNFSDEDFRSNYLVSLILPQGEEKRFLGHNRPYLLLSRREEWDNMQKNIEILHKSQREFDAYELLYPECEIWNTIPEEFLFSVDVIDENILLTPLSFIDFLPNFQVLNPGERYKEVQKGAETPPIHISLHSSKVMLPILTMLTGCWSFDNIALLEKYLSEDNVDCNVVLKEW